MPIWSVWMAAALATAARILTNDLSGGPFKKGSPALLDRTEAMPW
jgi:hypothetical protein